MEPTEVIWMNGGLRPWADAHVHVLTHALHYGSGVFEGIRAYETLRGAAVFRLGDHIKRLVYSARVLAMPLPYGEDELTEAVLETVRHNKLRHCYIRPIAFYGYGVMGLNPRQAPVDVVVACWPWGAYLPHEAVDVKVSDVIRIHPRSTVADAKIVGHYVNSIQAVLPLRGTKYHEALFLDYEGNIAEGPGENIFLVVEGRLITPAPGSILPGITRSTVMELADRNALAVEERTVSLDDLFAADEAFFTGTAAEVTPIRSVNDQVIGTGEVGPITKLLKEEYRGLVTGHHESLLSYLSFVE